MPNKTKIIATIGPSSNTKPILKKMVDAGMNVARLNFSHGTYEMHGEVINHIRSLSRTMNRPIGIMIDLQGPKIRTGRLKNGEPVLLEKNKTVSITTRQIQGTPERIATTYKDLVQDVNCGDPILLDDGLIKLKVLTKKEDIIDAEFEDLDDKSTNGNPK